MEEQNLSPMTPNALVEHPEGGRFQEVFRSAHRVQTDNAHERSALTHIYFSLNPGEVSRFHRVTSDEVWNLYRGEGIKLTLWDGSHRRPKSVILSALENCFCHVVPAGMWQATEPLSDKVLVGCSVAPGFEFADFTLMDPASAEAEQLRALAPTLEHLISGV
ncbi:hypothetical protein HMF8227_00167 [Saliniradius amylolyticus]|uniref:DUF985 domain-containing protein n=1 Tax=Saliniradius amylolyticus TaxID=2183582 RepID=A0A2S2DZ40_9ALTE|nr:cupin domain-containing protein [Saliniradius amylolyticus]AWL10675.1 hypothetical protein HMF8227_00167 [Saliniradius amylolyticus]